MKTLHTQKKVVAVIPYAIALLLFVALLFSYAAIEAPAYASENNDETEAAMPQWRVNTPLQLQLRSEDYTYAEFYAPSGGEFVLTITGQAGVIAQNNAIKKIAGGIYSVMLKEGEVYSFGFKALEAPYVAEIIICAESVAFQWRIDGSSADDKENLLRGGEYNIVFFANGAQWDTEINTMSSDSYIFAVEGVKLVIDEKCPIGGSGITFVAKSGDIVFEKSLTVIPAFESKIQVEGTYNDNTNRGLFWRYQAGITALIYNVEYSGQSCTVTMDSLNGRSLDSLNHGQLYPLEIGADIKGIAKKSDSAEVSITGVQLATASDGTTNYEIIQSAATVATRVAWVGSGTEADPYQVSSVAHFNDIAGHSSTSYFKQTVDLNFNNTATTRDVTFYGIYDGNLKQILNIKLTSPTILYDGGLFDHNEGTIKNLKKVTVNIAFTSYLGWIGGLVGYNKGTIYTPYYSDTLIPGIEATITATNYGIIGGVAGRNTGSVIMQDAVYVKITTNITVGGIVGENNGGGICTDISMSTARILGSYVYGSIYYTYSEYYYVGGIAAVNSGGTLFFVLSQLYINVYVSSGSSSLKPRVGGIIGMQSNGGSIFGYSYAGSFYSNLNSSQKTYVDFSNDYIGELLP